MQKKMVKAKSGKTFEPGFCFDPFLTSASFFWGGGKTFGEIIFTGSDQKKHSPTIEILNTYLK
jgi:hypothetical protein